MDITAAEALTLGTFLAMWGLFWLGAAVFGHQALRRWKRRNGITWDLPPLAQVLIGVALVLTFAYTLRASIPPSLTMIVGAIAMLLLPVALRLGRWVFPEAADR